MLLQCGEHIHGQKSHEDRCAIIMGLDHLYKYIWSEVSAHVYRLGKVEHMIDPERTKNELIQLS